MRARRPIAGLAVLGLCAFALAQLTRTACEVPRSRQMLQRRAWSVRVDGWEIELEGVTGRLPPPASAPSRRGGQVAPPVLRQPALPFEKLIAEYARRAGFDWRLVAAIIFEESRFDPHAVSPAGARGLMQVREIAARDVGELEFRDPAANVRAGVRYLSKLTRIFAAADGRDRLALVLAAYNMGPAHVRDGQRLAKRLGYDPWGWDGAMKRVLPLLEEAEFHRRLRHGYARGRATVAYVDRVLRRFDSYRTELSALPTAAGWTILFD